MHSVKWNLLLLTNEKPMYSKEEKSFEQLGGHP